MSSKQQLINRKKARPALEQPSVPTELSTWGESHRVATVVPDGPMPDSVLGIPVGSWVGAPVWDEGWQRLADGFDFEEPAFELPAGMNPASGAVIVEPDQRVWVVSPSNQFHGYTHTFPKGTLADGGLSLRANALKEVHEESGLQIALTGFLADSQRTQSMTRYYLGVRRGGSPADMGWESQAVNLVPLARLADFLNHEFDKRIARLLARRLA